MAKKIHRIEALRARVEELKMVWEDGETIDSLERRLARFSVGGKPAFYIPPEADGIKCFGYYYDEDANECPHSGVCEISEACFMVTRAKIEDLVKDRKPKYRMG